MPVAKFRAENSPEATVMRYDCGLAGEKSPAGNSTSAANYESQLNRSH